MRHCRAYVPSDRSIPKPKLIPPIHEGQNWMCIGPAQRFSGVQNIHIYAHSMDAAFAHWLVAYLYPGLR